MCTLRVQMARNLIRVAGSCITYALPPFSAHRGAESICPIMKLDGGMKTVIWVNGNSAPLPHPRCFRCSFLSWSQSLKRKGANLPGEQFSFICGGKTYVGTAETSVGKLRKKPNCCCALGTSPAQPSALPPRSPVHSRLPVPPFEAFPPEAGSAVWSLWGSCLSL